MPQVYGDTSLQSLKNCILSFLIFHPIHKMISTLNIVVLDSHVLRILRRGRSFEKAYECTCIFVSYHHLESLARQRNWRLNALIEAVMHLRKHILQSGVAFFHTNDLRQVPKSSTRNSHCLTTSISIVFSVNANTLCSSMTQIM